MLNTDLNFFSNALATKLHFRLLLLCRKLRMLKKDTLAKEED